MACAQCCRPGTNEFEKYQKNAFRFEQWACDVLRQCRNEDDAELLLLRPDMSGEWKSRNQESITVLRLALEGSNKYFISTDYVQRLVNKIWEGKLDPKRPNEGFDANEDEDDDEAAQRGTSPCWGKGPFDPLRFLRRPKIKFRLRAISYLIFLVLLGVSLSQVPRAHVIESAAVHLHELRSSRYPMTSINDIVSFHRSTTWSVWTSLCLRCFFIFGRLGCCWKRWTRYFVTRIVAGRTFSSN